VYISINLYCSGQPLQETKHDNESEESPRLQSRTRDHSTDQTDGKESGKFVVLEMM